MPAVAYVPRVRVCCGQLVCLLRAVSVLDAGSWFVCCGQLVCLTRAVSVFVVGSRIRPTCVCLLPAVGVFDAGS
jgi:hypothetical protein